MQAQRLPNWRARFADEMDRQRREAFTWGRHDCALGLAAGAYEAITGKDVRSDWSRYRTAGGALRALRKAGYASLGDAVAAYLPEVHPSQAHVGDIGLIPADGEIGAALCVVDASGL
ncbi:DUF6950 family protein, partial [Pseudogemmobacter faecipullorum]